MSAVRGISAVGLFCFCVVFLFSPGHSFPAYLLSASNCWTQLSTDEVIMNAAVVAADASDDPSMHIRIVTESDTIVTLAVATSNSNTNPDYHWVMDVVVEGEEASPCSFVKGSCDNRNRIIGRAHDTVDLQRPDSMTACTVVAGWSAGHEEVRLTPVVQLGSTAAQQQQQHREARGQDESQKVVAPAPIAVDEEEVHHESILEIPGVEKKEDPQRLVDAKHDLNAKLQKQIDGHWREQVEKEKKTRHQKIKHIEEERKHEHQIHKNLLHYEIGFETVGISWTGYTMGALFLITASAIFVLVSLRVSQSGEKGRRSL